MEPTPASIHAGQVSGPAMAPVAGGL